LHTAGTPLTEYEHVYWTCILKENNFLRFSWSHFNLVTCGSEMGECGSPEPNVRVNRFAHYKIYLVHFRVSKISYIYERREYYKRGSIFYVKHPGNVLIPNLEKGGKVREARVLRVGE
jgi:hypothetical protein